MHITSKGCTKNPMQMIEIKKATPKNANTLALLGRRTYIESHGHFIKDKNDLIKYVSGAFSNLKIREEIGDPNTIFYIAYVEGLPVGYIKLVLNAQCNSVASNNSCQLERIYILNDFIPLKIGQQILDLAENKAKELDLNTMWLSVYTKNERAIRFYKKNGFKKVGSLDFLVNGINYENYVFSKKL